MKVWWSDPSACVSSFFWKLTWSLVLLTITRLSLRKQAIQNCSVPIRGYFTKRNIFITDIAGWAQRTGDIYKTRYCFKSPAALCRRLHNAGSCEVVTLPVVAGDVPDLAASLLSCYRASTGRGARATRPVLVTFLRLWNVKTFDNTFTQPPIGLGKRERTLLLASSESKLIMLMSIE